MPLAYFAVGQPALCLGSTGCVPLRHAAPGRAYCAAHAADKAHYLVANNHMDPGGSGWQRIADCVCGLSAVATLAVARGRGVMVQLSAQQVCACVLSNLTIFPMMMISMETGGGDFMVPASLI